MFFVGLESFVKVNVTVKDINDNKPELAADDVFLCESDVAGTVIIAGFDEARFACVQRFLMSCVDVIRCIGCLMQQKTLPLCIYGVNCVRNF